MAFDGFAVKARAGFVRRRMVHFLLSLPLLVGIASSSAGEEVAWRFEFKMFKGENYSLCREYLAGLKHYVETNPDADPFGIQCGLKVAPEYAENFREPKWEAMVPEENLALIQKSISAMLGEKGKKHYDYHWSTAKTNMEQGRYHLWRSRFDVDNDGKRDEVIATEREGLCGERGDPVQERRKAVSDSVSHFKVDGGSPVYQHSIPAESTRYFFYKGRTYLVRWSQGMGPLDGNRFPNPFDPRAMPARAWVALDEPMGWYVHGHPFFNPICKINIKYIQPMKEKE